VLSRAGIQSNRQQATKKKALAGKRHFSYRIKNQIGIDREKISGPARAYNIDPSARP
jgi:hypothetical protein